MTCITEMMDHLVKHCDKEFAGTPYGPTREHPHGTYVIFHDALSQWWEKEAQDYLEETYGIGRTRQLCIYGSTNDLVEERYKNKLTGDHPEFCPLDHYIFAEYEIEMSRLVAYTADLEKGHDEKWTWDSPKAVQELMLHTWENEGPGSGVIVRDILRWPRSIKEVIENQGVSVEKTGTKRGRRKSRVRWAPKNPSPEVEKRREAKWEKLDPEYAARRC